MMGKREQCKSCKMQCPDSIFQVKLNQCRIPFDMCFDYTPLQTNADRIRSMSDEELAKFIRSVQCCSHYGDDCGYPFCHSMCGDWCNGIKNNTNKELLEWLQSESRVESENE